MSLRDSNYLDIMDEWRGMGKLVDSSNLPELIGWSFCGLAWGLGWCGFFSRKLRNFFESFGSEYPSTIFTEAVVDTLTGSRKETCKM